MLVAVLLIGLLVAVVQLWNRMSALREQVEMLEARIDMAATLAADSRRPGARDIVAMSVPRAGQRAIIVDPDPVPENSPPVALMPEPRQVAPEAPIAPQAPAEWIGTAALHTEDERPPARAGFEELFGRKLPIWGGGITLAVAGMLIVKYSIDAGLLPPIVRVVMGLLFGTALIGGAEAALRFADKVGDVRVRQSLAGAGLASLYASVLVAANLYHLIGSITAFAGLAAITALALGLSLRFGTPSALLGLIGGLAAPALVGSNDPNIPLLAIYLAVAVGGLCAVSRSQRWLWLGISALVGGFGWGVLLVLGGALNSVGSLAVGTYLLILGIVFPIVFFVDGNRMLIRLAGSGIAALQIAMLVAHGGFTLLDWGLFGLISLAIMWLSRREPAMARLPVLGLAIMVLLLTAWPHPSLRDFAIVLTGGAILYALPLLQRVWRDGANEIEAAQVAAVALAGLALPLLHFHTPLSDDRLFAALGCVAALLPAAAAMLGWRTAARHVDARFAILVTTSTALFAAALMLGLPAWASAPAIGGLAAGQLLLALRAHDKRVEYTAWSFGLLALLVLTANPDFGDELQRAAGLDQPRDLTTAVIALGGLAGSAALFAWRAKLRPAAQVAQAIAAVLAYGTIAQFAPIATLPLLPALALTGMALWSRPLPHGRLLPAMAALLGVSILWATWPLAQWAVTAALSTLGVPVLLPSLPRLVDASLRLAGPAILLVASVNIAGRQLDILSQRAIGIIAAIFGVMALHIAYKHGFALHDQMDFTGRGFAERTLWEALLFAIAIVAWRLARRPLALAIGTAGTAHFIGYSLLLHNPLWADQAVGGWPIFNWLLPAYALPLLLLWLVARADPDRTVRFDRVRSIAQMILILLFVASSLRQMFHGTLLSLPGVTPAEDIARSLLAVVAALGFLGWGIRRRTRDWRIASLVLMLAAVGKVFLLDAAGLDGLARIASFVALGLSLIGIGWLYSRFLRPELIEPR